MAQRNEKHAAPKLQGFAFVRREFAMVLSFLLISLATSPPVSLLATPAFETMRTAQERTVSNPLAPGLSQQKELKGGETHAYSIQLVAEQFMHTVVVQQGIDVVLTLHAADGKQLLEVDSPNGTDGPEAVFLIAEVAGSYRLTVRSLEKDAPPGRYTIKIETLRRATSHDRKRLLAETTFAQAEQLRGQRTAPALRGAIEQYGLTLPLWRELGDPAKEFATLNHLGNLHYLFGETRKALEYFEQVLAISRATGNRQGEALMLNNTGLLYDMLGETQKALEHHKRALEIRRALGDKGGEATTLVNIGVAYTSLGERQKALDHFRQALPLTRAVADRRGEAVALNNIGLIHYSSGQLQEALEYYQQSLPLYRVTGDFKNEVLTLNNLGATHLMLGNTQEALSTLNRALEASRASGDIRGQAVSHSNLGATEYAKRDLPKALEHQNQARALWTQIGERRGIAEALISISGVYWLMGEHPKSLEHATQALEYSRAIGSKAGEVMSRFGIARAHSLLGNLAEGRSQIDAALNVVEAQRSSITNQQLRTSYFATFDEYYELYISLLMRLHVQNPSAGHDAAALGASERARARGLLELLKESRADIRRNVDPLLVEREQALQNQLNAKADQQVTLLSGRHTPEQARTIAAQLKALTTDYENVQTQIRQTSPRYAALTQPVALGLKEIQQQVLDADTLLLEYKLGEERSFLWVVSQSAIHSYELPKRDLIAAASRRALEALIARNNRIADENPIQRAARLAKAETEYTEAAVSLSEMLLGPAADHLGRKRLVIVADGALQYLSFAGLPQPRGVIRGPAAERKPSRRSARQDPSVNVRRPLIADHEIVSLPSASAMAVLRGELYARRSAPKAVAVLADPVFEELDPRVTAKAKTLVRADEIGRGRKAAAKAGPASSPLTAAGVEQVTRDLAAGESVMNIPRLPYSRREANAILAAAPRGAGMQALDFRASRATATSPQLAEYRMIHFATHGFIHDLHPELSGVVLSLVDEQGRRQDGFLRLHEIYNLNLSADLVVLSACQTALGKEIKGEGLVSLTRGFMYAGAPRVVASLWKVDDAATAELMSHFYRAMLRDKMRPAEALRAAQIKMWQQPRWQSPYYWAAFVLQGEWN